MEARLEAKLREILDRPQQRPSASPLEAAMSGVQVGATDQAASTRDFMKDTVRRLGELEQKRPPTGDFDEALMESLVNSVPVVVEFARLADAIGRHGAREAGLAMVMGFASILERYEFRTGQGGGFYETDFDFFKFIGHEMFAVFVAAMMRHDRWELLAALLEEPIVTNTSSGRKSRRFSDLSAYVTTLAKRNERLQLRRVCLHGNVLKERHEAEPLLSIAPFKGILEADWFLFLGTDLAQERGPNSPWFDIWRPWSCIYAENHGIPEFLARMERRKFVERILPALGFTDLDAFRERYRERAQKLGEVFQGSGAYFFRTPAMDANRIGST